jgi:hypothetical protein
MQKFLIEVPHEANEMACIRIVKNFLELGSHLLANAEWGCLDGIHKLWVLVETEDKDQARLILPPAFRADAIIVGLNKFTVQDIEKSVPLQLAGMRA